MNTRSVAPVVALIIVIGLVIALLIMGSPLPLTGSASQTNSAAKTNTGATNATNTSTPKQSEMVLLPPGASKPLPLLGMIVTVETATIEPCEPTTTNTNTNDDATDDVTSDTDTTTNTNSANTNDCAVHKANIGVAVVMTGNGQQPPSEPKRIVFGSVPSTQAVDQYVFQVVEVKDGAVRMLISAK